MSAEYWIWLQQVLGYSSCSVGIIKAKYKTAKNFYLAPDSEKIAVCKLSKAQVSRLHKVTKRTVFNIINECNKTGITIITPEDKEYPERLLNIPDPPAVLYVKGKMADFDKLPVVSIVGPRKCSYYGEKCAYVIANTLASCGFMVVSGGAMGGDSAAHQGALDEGKPTVAVLGSGINSDYLKANSDLRARIAENGCLISEFPPSYGASRSSFPIRNRIISGLSNGVIVVEGSAKSGTLITARHASEQGRDVFVIPGSPSHSHYEGSNKLISDGAKMLLNINDVINEYRFLYPNIITMPSGIVSLPENDGGLTIATEQKIKGETEKPQCDTIKDDSCLSEQNKVIFNAALQFNGDFTVDDIVEHTSLDVGSVIGGLTELEIFGFVLSTCGGRYRIKN